MIASLPMYDRPSTAAALDRLWDRIRDGLRARGIGAPEALTREVGNLLDHWLAPDLVLSQACGYPYRAVLHGKVALVGTPDFGLSDCPPGHYCSRVVVRADDPRERLEDFAGARFAYNDALSQSGWAALATHAPGALGGPLVETGAHAVSAAAVAEGRADFAALDAVTWDLLSQDGTATPGLRVLASTPPTPGLPLIASLGADAAAMFEPVADAIAGLPAEDRASTRLVGLVRIPAAAYLDVPTPPAPAHFARTC